jgi:2,3-bisphosphoglycerate-dependent phosphoglycerate mutase
MTVYLKVGFMSGEIGTGDFLHCFFSTISGNLEPRGWGTRFPIVMTKLYEGELKPHEIAVARREFDQIKLELSKLPIDRVIWDYHKRSAQPPWGTNVADSITDLSNYFVTSTGRDMLQMIGDLLGYADQENSGALITSGPL